MNTISFLKSKALAFLSAASLLALLFSVSFAQAGSASVRGIVSDPQGHPVPGATVTIANSEKSFTRTQVTNDTGGYVFSSIPPGTYRQRDNPCRRWGLWSRFESCWRSWG